MLRFDREIGTAQGVCEVFNHHASCLSQESIMTLPASALPVEAPPAFLGVSNSATGKLWRDRLDARGADRALAIVQRHQLPEMLARGLAGGGGGGGGGGGVF